MEIKIDYSNGRIQDFWLIIPIVPTVFEKHLAKYLDEKKYLKMPEKMSFTEQGTIIHVGYCKNNDISVIVKYAAEIYENWEQSFKRFSLMAEMADFALAYREIKKQTEVQDEI